MRAVVSECVRVDVCIRMIVFVCTYVCVCMLLSVYACVWKSVRACMRVYDHCVCADGVIMIGELSERRVDVRIMYIP